MRCGPISPVAGSPKNDASKRCARSACHVAFRRVVGDAAIAIDVAQRCERKSLRRVERGRLPLRIDRAEEEQPVAQDRSADRGADIAQSRRDGVDRPFDALHGVVRGFEAVRLRVAERAAPELVRPALGDDVDHAAGRLSELRFVAAGLHLDFLHEVVRRAVAERAEHDRVRPERAIAAVGDVHAVDDVLILETARAFESMDSRRPTVPPVLTPGAR